MQVVALELSAVALLEELRENSVEAVKRLDPVEHERVLAGLAAVTEQAATVRTATDSVALFDAVHRLVEETEGLRSWLLGPVYDTAAQQRARCRLLTHPASKATTGPSVKRTWQSGDIAAESEASAHAIECASTIRNLTEDVANKLTRPTPSSSDRPANEGPCHDGR